MSEIWIIAETRGTEIKRVSWELVSAARALGADSSVCLVLTGPGLAAAAGEAAAHGVDRVLLLDDARLAQYSPEGWAGALAELARQRQPAAILGPATARGRDLLPRLAAKLEVGLASDVIELGMDGSSVTALRPIYAGKALARVAIQTRPAMLTVRPNSFPIDESSGGAELVTCPLGDYEALSRSAGVEVAASTRPDVAEADIIVSGGRGMGAPEHFAMLEELADLLRAAVGASRAVVDAGWRPHGDQVGQTGKTVSPSLYVACGISGAVQHLAGMKTSKYIVAINKDAEAPIFGVADYGIVGDVFEVIPALTEALRAQLEG
jgi:electron transfer flavoprotein alpha subunit